MKKYIGATVMLIISAMFIDIYLQNFKHSVALAIGIMFACTAALLFTFKDD